MQRDGSRWCCIGIGQDDLTQAGLLPSRDQNDWHGKPRYVTLPKVSPAQIDGIIYDKLPWG